MLYEFKSKAAGTVVMTQPVAERLLAIIGKDPGPAGVFEPEHLETAIAALQTAVAQERPVSQDDEEPETGPGGEPVRRVSLAQRAWPLIDLFRQALAARKRVTWGV